MSATRSLRAQAPTLPRSDEASGIAVPAEREDYSTENTLLAAPRALVRLVFAAPRYAAVGVDYYLESRSPNAFARDVKSTWRVGFIADYEERWHTSIGARLGYEFAEHFIVDGTGGLFGIRGKTGGGRVSFGTFDVGVPLAPSIEAEIARDIPRRFAGIGENNTMPRFNVEERHVNAGVHLSSKLGPIKLRARSAFTSSLAEDENAGEPDAVTDGPTGLGERVRSLTGELVATLDSRSKRYPWIHQAAPATGTFVEATLAYTRGEGDQLGNYDVSRASLEARQLFDLFHGDRVITVAARTEILSDDAMSVPFMQLPALGGPVALRAYSRDVFRDRAATHAEIEYAWPIGGGSRAYVFVETGEVHDGYAAFEPSSLHIGYGGGIRVFEGATSILRFHIAGADGEDVGVFAQVGAL